MAPSVFVYPFPRELTGEYLYDNITSGDHDYHFRGELELLERFRAYPQAHPSRATLLLVPFMIVQAFTKLQELLAAMRSCSNGRRGDRSHAAPWP